MLITRKNIDEIFEKTTQDLIKDCINPFNLFMNHSTISKIREMRLIYRLFCNDQELYIGSVQRACINLTEFRIQTHWQGKNTEDALKESMKNLLEETLPISYDPWGKQRRYLKSYKIEGIKIHHINADKNVIVGSLLFYDGFNMYMSALTKISYYHSDKWYMSNAADDKSTSEYLAIESTTNILYNLIKY